MILSIDKYIIYLALIPPNLVDFIFYYALSAKYMFPLLQITVGVVLSLTVIQFSI